MWAGARGGLLAVALIVGMPLAVAGCGRPEDGRPSATPSSVTAAPAPTAAPTTSTRPPVTGTRPPASGRPPTTTTVRGLPSALAGTEWTRLPTGRKVVALTFDAGGDAAGVPSILKTLRARGVPATFFLTGAWTRRFPASAHAVGASHPVGNHTDSHPHLPALSEASVRDELLRAQGAILAGAGRDPRPLLRFPYGDSDPRTIRTANRLGYGSIGWTVDTWGWKGTSGGQSVATVVRRVVDGLVPGTIVLLHVGANPDDGSTLDADALPTIVAELRARGYGLVTVDQYV